MKRSTSTESDDLWVSTSDWPGRWLTILDPRGIEGDSLARRAGFWLFLVYVVHMMNTLGFIGTLGEQGNRLAGLGWRYLPRGRVRHLFLPYWVSLCGLDLGQSDLRGTGSQEEYEHLAGLPVCASCARLMAR